MTDLAPTTHELYAAATLVADKQGLIAAIDFCVQHHLSSVWFLMRSGRMREYVDMQALRYRLMQRRPDNTLKRRLQQGT